MKIRNLILIAFVAISGLATNVFGKGPENPSNAPKPDNTGWRAACVRPTKQTDMEINNVKVRLKTGGEVWNISSTMGGYIVPKPAQGQPSVSAIYAGGVWIGGVDRAGAIKLCAVTYSSEGSDFFSGPLDLNGTTDDEVCKSWDRFFTVKGKNVKSHINYVLKSIENGVEIDCDSIPDDVKYWPAQGNPHWREKFTFSLPDQELAGYWDKDGNGYYSPCGGDWPIIEIRDCEPSGTPEKQDKDAQELVADEMVFWIYNDNGGTQTLSGPKSIQMEVQVQSFAYATADAINDMTFYRYKLLNKANEDLIDCYFAIWIDPDLGCYADDYIGCDKNRSLAYVYNQDAVDGNNGSACSGGSPTYGSDIPVVGMDYFRGPRGPRVFKVNDRGEYIYEPVLNVNGDTVRDASGAIKYQKVLLEPKPYSGQQDTLVELGMTSFVYHEGQGAANSGMGDPQRGREEGFYNLIRGFWQDGTAVTFGGNGYNPSSMDTVKYVFPADPDKTGWSMCSAALPFADRRTLQATGPLLLQTGAKNELIMGVVYVPSLTYPCPDIQKLKAADDIAQALFDNCFDITDGPDAPDVTCIELDQELILMLSNETSSNNFNETYSEVDLQAPVLPNGENEYKFEGYRIFQVADASVTAQELNDISKARPIFQVDVKNGVTEIFNWIGQPNPLDPVFGATVWIPTKAVSGENLGIKKSLKVTEDQFALKERRLVNHKQYHFVALAYAHNNYANLDNLTGVGQKRAYLEGRTNVGNAADGNRPYTFVPRPIVYENLNSQYGNEPVVTRIAGEGNPNKFLEMDDTMYDIILKNSFDGRIVYKKGATPLDVKVVNPLKMKDGIYRLEITGNFATSSCAFDNDAVWKLSNVTDKDNIVVLLDNRPLSFVREYLVNNLGFSISMNSESEPGTTRLGKNGGVGASITYANSGGDRWFDAVKDGGRFRDSFQIRNFEYVRDGFDQDPLAALSRLGDGYFVPFISSRWKTDVDLPYYLSPSARNVMDYITSININSLRLRDLNNVDIVLTSDKTKWSKCIVVETAFDDQILQGLSTIGNAKNFELRTSPSIDQNGNVIPNSTGFSYFPGYAVDVETGKRLNIFFGENSIYSGDNAKFLDGNNPLGGDMIFNPSTEYIASKLSLPSSIAQQMLALVGGGQHYIYVTRMEYDSCADFAAKLKKPNANAGPTLINKSKVASAVTWTSFVLPRRPMLPLDKGLIPNDLTYKLRVNNPYSESRKYSVDRERFCDTDGDQPVYEFEFKGTESKQLVTQDEYEGALANVNVVPNPYYAYSAYETSQFTNVIKVTNLPAKAIVTIYSLDGAFIRQYNRDERGAILTGNNRPTSTGQVYPDLEWDMKNFKGIPVASGVYLIHIQAPDYGEERTLKWFGIGRKFDPSGL
jgi:hypothetical protein